MKRSVLFLFALVLALTACGQNQAAGTATPFDYDASVPFDASIRSEEEDDGVTVIDLNYAAHDPDFAPITAGRTVAYLVRPAGEGLFAGIVYLHRRLPSGSRATFLEEAIEMAKLGAVSLLVQGYYPYQTVPENSRDDRPNIIGQVVELRRALDLLLSQPGVDPARIGFVGQDYGGLYGGVLAGVDGRLRTLVLVAALPDFGFTDGYEFNPPPDYMDFVGDLNPSNYIGNATPASILFQFGERDNLIPEERAEALAALASDPKRVTWYDDLHAMESEPVIADRAAWLTQELGLDPGQP
jgi:dienelactone hydrolase